MFDDLTIYNLPFSFFEFNDLQFTISSSVKGYGFLKCQALLSEERASEAREWRRKAPSALILERKNEFLELALYYYLVCHTFNLFQHLCHTNQMGAQTTSNG